MIILPIKTVSLTNQREHWRARHRRTQYQREVVGLLMPSGVPVPCTCKLTRISPGILDDDNLPASLKSVRDEIAKRSGIDDRDPRVVWQYGQQRAGTRRYEVLVEVMVAVDNRAKFAQITHPDLRAMYAENTAKSAT